MWPFPHLLPWFGCCCNPSRCPQLWTWYIRWGGLWLGEWGGTHSYSFLSIYWWVGSLVLVIASHLFSLWRRNWLHRVTWICGLSLFWGVPVRIWYRAACMRGKRTTRWKDEGKGPPGLVEWSRLGLVRYCLDLWLILVAHILGSQCGR